MQTTDLYGNWEEQKKRLRKKITDLTETDSLFVNGKKAAIIEKLQVQLGKTKEEVVKIIETLESISLNKDKSP